MICPRICVFVFFLLLVNVTYVGDDDDMLKTLDVRSSVVHFKKRQLVLSLLFLSIILFKLYLRIPNRFDHLKTRIVYHVRAHTRSVFEIITTLCCGSLLAELVVTCSTRKSMSSPCAARILASRRTDKICAPHWVRSLLEANHPLCKLASHNLYRINKSFTHGAVAICAGRLGYFNCS